jgi:serine/threonine protein kinase
VVDWGIAIKRDTVETGGGLVGTPLYMAPEQAAGGTVDERSDIYSLSLMLLEWLTLSHPLAGKPSIEAVLSTLLTDGIDASLFALKVALVRAGAPSEYAELLSRGLAREPSDRFSTVDELEHALRNVRDGKGPVSCHITLTKRMAGELVDFVDRRPVLYSLFFLGGLGLVGAGAWSGITSLLRLFGHG